MNIYFFEGIPYGWRAVSLTETHNPSPCVGSRVRSCCLAQCPRELCDETLWSSHTGLPPVTNSLSVFWRRFPRTARSVTCLHLLLLVS